MNISPNEAEESLVAVEKIMQKTRRSIASSGVHISLVVTGLIWLIGFICTQFIKGQTLIYIWIGISVIGSMTASILGFRSSRRVHISNALPTARRIGLIWLLLVVYCLAAIAIGWPLDGKQLTMFINLFVLIGWLFTSQQLSSAPIWPGLIIIAFLLGGYFLLPEFYYLWMAIVGGGSLISLGLYIRLRW
jgi:hypothetical protein